MKSPGWAQDIRLGQAVSFMVRLLARSAKMSSCRLPYSLSNLHWGCRSLAAAFLLIRA